MSDTPTPAAPAPAPDAGAIAADCGRAEALDKAATPAPWYVTYSDATDDGGLGPSGLAIGLLEDDAADTFAFSETFRFEVPDSVAGNFALMAASRTLLPSLAAHCRALIAENGRVNREYGPVPEEHMRCGKCRVVLPDDDCDMWCACGGDWERSQDDYLGKIRLLGAQLQEAKNENVRLRERVKTAHDSLIAVAETQEHFASPAYTQHSDRERVAYQETAKQYRRAAALLADGGKPA